MALDRCLLHETSRPRCQRLAELHKEAFTRFATNADRFCSIKSRGIRLLGYDPWSQCLCHDPWLLKAAGRLSLSEVDGTGGARPSCCAVVLGNRVQLGSAGCELGDGSLGWFLTGLVQSAVWRGAPGEVSTVSSVLVSAEL